MSGVDYSLFTIFTVLIFPQVSVITRTGQNSFRLLEKLCSNCTAELQGDAVMAALQAELPIPKPCWKARAPEIWEFPWKRSLVFKGTHDWYQWYGWIHLDVRKVWWNHKDPSYLELLGQYRYTWYTVHISWSAQSSKTPIPGMSSTSIDCCTHSYLASKGSFSELSNHVWFGCPTWSSWIWAATPSLKTWRAISGLLLLAACYKATNHILHVMSCFIFCFIVSSSALFINNFTPSCTAAVIVIASGRTVLPHSWDQTRHARAIPIRRWSNVLQHLQG